MSAEAFTALLQLLREPWFAPVATLLLIAGIAIGMAIGMVARAPFTLLDAETHPDTHAALHACHPADLSRATDRLLHARADLLQLRTRDLMSDSTR